MEEQRARQEDEARKVAQQSAEEAGVKPAAEGISATKFFNENNLKMFNTHFLCK